MMSPSLSCMYWLCLHSLNPIVGRGVRREEASGPRTFDLHQPRQRGRHDPFAIAPGDPSGACESVHRTGLPATRARQSAGATGHHEMEGWFRGMVVLFRMP